MKTRTKLITLSLAVVLLLALIPTMAFAQGNPGDQTPQPGPQASLTRALIKTAAEVLGMTPEDFVQAMRDGKTPAELAAEAGVPVETLTAALQTTWNDEGVKYIDHVVNDGFPPGGRNYPDCQRQLRLARAWVGVVAETLGLEPVEFLELLKDGGTPAEIAEGYGSSGQALIDAIVAAEQARLDQAVAEGKITQEQADNILARHTEAATEWINEGKNPVSPQCRRKAQVARHWTKIAAETVGIETKDFVTALREGQTPAQIAEANGSSGEAIIGAIVADAQARLDQAVADGKITQEQADRRLIEITERATHWVENGLPQPPPAGEQPDLSA